MATCPALRGRLEEAGKRLDSLQREIEAIAGEAERTKVKIVARANGAYVRQQELLRGKVDKS